MASQNLTYFHEGYYEWGHLKKTVNIQMVLGTVGWFGSVNIKLYG